MRWQSITTGIGRYAQSRFASKHNVHLFPGICDPSPMTHPNQCNGSVHGSLHRPENFEHKERTCKETEKNQRPQPAIITEQTIRQPRIIACVQIPQNDKSILHSIHDQEVVGSCHGRDDTAERNHRGKDKTYSF